MSSVKDNFTLRSYPCVKNNLNPKYDPALEARLEKERFDRSMVEYNIREDIKNGNVLGLADRHRHIIKPSNQIGSLYTLTNEDSLEKLKRDAEFQFNSMRPGEMAAYTEKLRAELKQQAA